MVIGHWGLGFNIMSLSIHQALLTATKALKKRSASPTLDAEVLLSFAINQPKEYILAHPEKQLTIAQEKKFRQLVARRSKGVPIAYLIGHKEFYGLDFVVNKSALIPRPETEMLVAEVLKQIPNSQFPMTNQIPNPNDKNFIIIDVGTGSGCIAITLAKLFPQAKIFALDISKNALQVARQNARRHKVNKQIKFIKNNLLKKFPIPNFSRHSGIPLAAGQFPIKSKRQNPNDQIIIVANLPYLTKKQLAEPSIKHEPRAALYGGKDGLEYYEKLFKQISQFGAQVFECSSVQVLLEIDPSQTSKIKKLIKKHLPTAKIKIKKDLAGLDRVVCITSGIFDEA